MQKILYAVFMSILIVSGLAISQDQQPINELEGFSEFVEARMEEWGVPGAAVGIIKDGEIIFAKGFGIRDKESREPVDENTLFMIGSCSKAFTAMSAAIAVEKGIINLDTPIIEYLPDFELSDPYITKNVTMRDLLLHRTGMGRQDLLTHGGNCTRSELINKYRYLQFEGNFRERFIYSNLMYILAGHVVGVASESTYEEFVRGNMLKPANMTNTMFSIAQMQKTSNYAKGYCKSIFDVKGDSFLAEAHDWQTNAPAGGVISNLKDMLAWLNLHLSLGSGQKSEVVTNRMFRELISPTMGKRYQFSGAYTSNASGMGWNIYNYMDHYLVMHTGITNGYCASVAFLPRDGFGVVVLTNLKMHSLQEVIAYNAIDRLLGVEANDFNAYYRSQWDAIEKMVTDASNELRAGKVDGTNPSKAKTEYVGKYTHPAFGTVEISVVNDEFRATLNSRIDIELEHYHYDTWLSQHKKMNEFNDMTFQFMMDTEGKISLLQIDQGEFMEMAEFIKEVE